MENTYRYLKYSDVMVRTLLDKARDKLPEMPSPTIFPTIIETEPANLNDYLKEYHKHAFDGPVSHETEDLEEWANGD